MKRDGQSLMVAFPSRMMSTARSAAVMGPEYAREVRNMYATADGAGSKRNGVVSIGDALADEVMVGVFSYQKPGVGMQLLAVTDAGKIYVKDGDGWEEVYSGLNLAGVPRTATFAGRLVLVNGFDPMLAWDGDAWSIVSEKVTDVAGGLTYVSATQFTIESDAGFYAVGTQVRAILDDIEVTANVSAVSQLGEVVTVTLASGVLTSDLSAVAYTAKAPVLSYIYAAHDRLWGFGSGALSAVSVAGAERSRVFYTYGVNDETAWHSPEGSIPSIGLADKSAGADEILAMAVRDGATVFLLRNCIQVWTGSTPGAEGDFAWSKTIPLGIVHGGLVVELPNDLAFVTRSGVRSLGRALQSEQLDVSDVGSEIDPTVASDLQVMLADDAVYKRALVMVNDAQNWFGLKLHDKTLVFALGTAGKGWAVFDGIFAGVTAACAAPDGVLYLAVGSRLYKYDSQVWSDDGAAIVTRWRTPWLRPTRNGKRWANRYVEVLSGKGAAIQMRVIRYRDFDDVDARLGMVWASVEPDYWDDADWDEAFWENLYPSPPAVRDPFVADEVSWAVESETTTGPLTLLGLKIYGVGER